MPISTANGNATAAVVIADTVSVGTISRRRCRCSCSRGQLEQSLLGMNFIGTLSGFDMRGDRMILRLSWVCQIRRLSLKHAIGGTRRS